MLFRFQGLVAEVSRLTVVYMPLSWILSLLRGVLLLRKLPFRGFARLACLDSICRKI